MSFTKHYTGKGTQVKGLDIVELNLKMSELEKHVFEYQGEKYVQIRVAKLKEPDQYGKTHTSYVSVRDQEEKDS